MDRRKFIKASLVGAGAMGVTGLPELMAAKARTEDRKCDCRLPAEDWVREPARRIPVVASAEVVVLGGGPAGVAAAISAARSGADVILLERYAYLGGLWTGGLVLPMLNTHGCSQTKEWTKVIYGISHEIFEKLMAMDMVIEPVRPVIDPEACKYLMEQMCKEAGVRLIYHSWAGDVTMSGNRIDTVLLETKSGRVAVRGKMFVDASGDGDLVAWSGQDHYEMKHHIGAMYRIGGVPDDKPAGGNTPVKGVRNMWIHGENDQDGLDVFNLSRIQTDLRTTMWDSVRKLREIPGYEDVYLLETPPQIGVRATRVLNSVSNVTFEGSMTYKSYKDSIGMSGGSEPMNFGGRLVPVHERPVWQIPYSSLVPKECPNLIVGGRCFGFEQELVYDAREIGTCLVTGQAAGTAAALASRMRISVQDVDVPVLQDMLVKQNVKLSM